MWNRTLVYTSLFSAIAMVFSLKFMEMFSFIKWSPIGWGKKAYLFSSMHFTTQWGLLFVGVFIVFIVLYMIMFYLHAIPPAMSAIFFTVVGVFAVEWGIHHSKGPWDVIQAMSIPFLAVTAIILRFISGTAVFYYELSRKE